MLKCYEHIPLDWKKKKDVLRDIATVEQKEWDKREAKI